MQLPPKLTEEDIPLMASQSPYGAKWFATALAQLRPAEADLVAIPLRG